MKLDPHSVRGVIRAFLERHCHLLEGHCLIVGSRDHSEGARPWMDVRTLRPDLEWTGMDMQPGHGVDIVNDVSARASACGKVRYDSAIVSEVLEHVENLDGFCEGLRRLMWPIRGTCLVTVPFAFHMHGFPDDYWRFTPSGLKVLAGKAGFRQVHVEPLAEVTLTYSDHGEKPGEFTVPRQIGAVWEKM